jgi:hypothetical protein
MMIDEVDTALPIIRAIDIILDVSVTGLAAHARSASQYTDGCKVNSRCISTRDDCYHEHSRLECRKGDQRYLGWWSMRMS